MRKFMALLLLAGAAVPSAAMAKPNDRSDEAKSEHSDRHQAQQQQQSNDSNGQRGDRSSGNNGRQNSNSYARSNGGNQAPAAVQVDRGNGGGGGQPNEVRHQRSGYQNNGGGQDAAAQTYTRNSSGSASNWRSHERRPVVQEQADAQQGWSGRSRDSSDSLRQYDRAPPHVMRSRVPVVSNVPRPGTQPLLRATQYNQRHQTTRWNGNWRNDHRYNWQDRRRHNRSLFHLGAYFDPFGWGYQRFSIGWRLWPSYFSQNYWFNPTQYGLPYAPPGYQWVRYYDDALLVDTWSGQVVDVMYNFFW